MNAGPRRLYSAGPVRDQTPDNRRATTL